MRPIITFYSVLKNARIRLKGEVFKSRLIIDPERVEVESSLIIEVVTSKFQHAEVKIIFAPIKAKSGKSRTQVNTKLNYSGLFIYFLCNSANVTKITFLSV